MGIMATIAPAIGCHPVWIALACLSGGNSIGHVKDVYKRQEPYDLPFDENGNLF